MLLAFRLLALIVRPFGIEPQLRRLTREVEPANGYRCYEPAGIRLHFIRRA